MKTGYTNGMTRDNLEGVVAENTVLNYQTAPGPSKNGALCKLLIKISAETCALFVFYKLTH